MLSPDDVLDILTLGKKIPDVWVLVHRELPWTVNEARNWHHHRMAKEVKKWREIGWALSLEAKVPKMQQAELHFITLVKRAGRDYGAEVLCAKAVADGALVDAGVLPDDRPPFVRFAGFHAPIKYSHAGMAMLIHRCA